MTQKTLQERVKLLEAWMKTFLAAEKRTQAAELQHEFASWYDTTKQKLAQKPVEETLTEKNAKARFGKTILELANEQLRSDSDHWAQKAHAYRDQVATEYAEKKELQEKFDVLSENCRALRMGETRKALEKAEANLEAALKTKKISQANNTALHNNIAKLKEQEDRTQKVAEGYHSAMLEQQSLKWEREAEIRELKARPSAWEEKRDAENTINSLRYQNKQGVNIRTALEVQVRERDVLIANQADTVVKQDDRIDKQLKTMTAQAGNIDRLEKNLDKYIKANQRQSIVHGEKSVEIAKLHENCSILQTKNKSQSDYIMTLIAKVDAKDDTIKRHLAHLDDADSTIEKHIKTIAQFRESTLLPVREVHVLMYKYKTHLQLQVAGVFTSRDLMYDWLEENPAAREEETEIYTYKLNQGEL